MRFLLIASLLLSSSASFALGCIEEEEAKRLATAHVQEKYPNANPELHSIFMGMVEKLSLFSSADGYISSDSYSQGNYYCWFDLSVSCAGQVKSAYDCTGED